jgi:2-polyprenyl-6-methoxyphenol hydroxylase-like FAD-dependent oxidoreductase
MVKGMTQDLDGTWILGGGLAGLATAAALLNITGLKSVVVLEKASKREHSIETAGAAVQIGPNGFRALKAIGGQELVQRVIDTGSILTGVIIASKNPSAIIPIAQNDDSGYPQVLIRWGAMRALLAELLPPDTVHHGFGADIHGYQRYDSTDFVVPVNQDGEIVGPSGTHPPLVLIAAGMCEMLRVCSCKLSLMMLSHRGNLFQIP